MNETHNTKQRLLAKIKKLEQEMNNAVEVGKKIKAENELLSEKVAETNRKESLLAAIMESPHGLIIFALDKNYRYIAFTSHHKEVMKNIWDKDIQIGMNMLDVISNPADRKKAKKNFDEALSGEHIELEEEYGDENLRRLIWENRYAPIFNDKNEIIGLSVYVLDITKRKVAEEELQASIQQLAASEQQIRATNQQVAANEQQLRANNQQLAATDQQLRAINQELIADKEILQKEKAFSENLLETAPVFILILNTHANILLFNKFAETITGYSKKEVMGKNWVDVFIPDQEKEKIPGIFSAVLEEMPDYSSYENPILLKNGTKKMIRWNNTLLKDEFGNISGILSMGIDITAQKKSENALIQSEEKLKTIFESSPTGIYVIDDQKKIIYCNKKVAEISGYPIEEILHQPFNKFLSPESVPLVVENYQKRIYGEKTPSQYRFDIIRQDGEKRTVEINASRITDNSGKLQVIAHIEDVTEKSKHEKVQQFLYDVSKIPIKDISLSDYIAQIHQQLKMLIKADNFYVALYHPDTGLYNFPYFVDEFDSFESTEYFDLRNTITDYVRKSKKGYTNTNETEKELLKKEKIVPKGTPAPIWLGAPLMNHDTGMAMGIIVVQDYKSKKAYSKDDMDLLEIVASNIGIFIDRIQTMESLKEAKEKAEESDRLKSAFLANMSHEIRTPMNGILGFTELIGDPNFTGEEKEEFVLNIKNSGERLLNTVNDIINISKIETGQEKVSVSQINVNLLIESFCQFFKLEAEAKGLKLFTNTPLPEKLAIIETDENKFNSIITNLIKNAIKFTNNGSINIGYDIILEEDSRFILFYVKDTGIGIPPSRKEAIFNRFEQADTGYNRSHEGSGLGLAITKAYIEMLGGKIWVESVEGKGSQFYFTLPYLQLDTGNVSLETEQENKKQKKLNHNIKILVAEDEELVRKYFSIILKDQAVKIFFANNGTEAVEIFRNHPDIDLILMDVRMPKMSGYEATQKIREFDKDVIIIAETAYALEGDEERALEAGCNDYISKPIKKGILIEKIHHLLKTKKNI